MSERFFPAKIKIDASIIIPTKNEEKNINFCLKAIFKQKTNFKFEVIVIDSGSSDHTTEIIKTFPGVHLVEIPSEDFGHGKTRNLGSSIAQGAYLIFLNGDAIPADKYWLNHLLFPYQNHQKLAGVFSRHIPKMQKMPHPISDEFSQNINNIQTNNNNENFNGLNSDCHLYMIRDILKSMPDEPLIKSIIAPFQFMNFSTVSCSIPKKIWKKHPFDNDIIIAEDQEWAKRIMKHGFILKYEPLSKVLHSHNYSPRQLYEIKFKVSQASKKFNKRFTAIVVGFFLIFGGIIYKFLGDIFFIVFNSKAWGRRSFLQKMKEIGIGFSARIASFWGKYMGWISQ